MAGFEHGLVFGWRMWEIKTLNLAGQLNVDAININGESGQKVVIKESEKSHYTEVIQWIAVDDQS